ncbi:hypothetical protein [Mycobacterium sp.]
MKVPERIVDPIDQLAGKASGGDPARRLAAVSALVCAPPVGAAAFLEHG